MPEPTLSSMSFLDTPPSSSYTEATATAVWPVAPDEVTLPSAANTAIAAPAAESTVERFVREYEPETTTVWDVPFAVMDMPNTLRLADEMVRARTPGYFVTSNLNYLMLVERFPRLVEVNRRATAVLADGNPIVIRSRFGVSPLPCRVAGSDLILELAKLAADRGYRIFFLGAAAGVAEAAAAKLLELNPTLQIAGCYSPPFRALSSVEQTEMIERIQLAQTDILLVAFGQPKGELWIFDHLQELKVPLCIQLGASFDFLAGTARRAPEAWQKLGLEWMYRMCCDPWRLAPRYGANILFLLRRIGTDLLRLFR
jgi:N-acetylglucosaminyldiphosphoundecaprenol N-acetyl-beta-D-mannosaminyltransferase